MAHDHDHAPASGFGRAFAIGIALNSVFVVVEAIAGLAVDSVGLLADAGHNASDVLSLIIAWIGAAMATRPPSKRFTYGFRRSPILASLFNALLLFGAMGVVVAEAIERLGHPTAVEAGTVVWVASIGLVVNFGTAALFMRGQQDLNIRGAYLHMLADGLVTLGVLVAGLVIHYTGFVAIDAWIGLVIVGVVLWSTWSLFKSALRLLLDAAPDNIDVTAVRARLLALPQVSEVHDLHIWAMSTSETALTAHLVVQPAALGSATVLEAARHALEADFGIGHVTLQLESAALDLDCDSCCELPAT